MKVIVGLGNPGFKYKKTRHNIGFTVLDALSRRLQIPMKKKKFNAAFGMADVNNEEVVLLAPLTYMNASGEAVRPFLDYFNVRTEDLAVIYDDLDLPTGKIRLRKKGSAGGHNGMKSVISHLGTQEFKRIRIGIQHPEYGGDVIDYVLRPFSRNEKSDVEKAVADVVSACEMWLSSSFPEVMNEYNR